MRVLTTENKPYSMDQVPGKVDDIRFCVFDYTDPNNVDYIFIPLIFLESYPYSVVELKIGPFLVQMPMDWSMVVGDGIQRELEIIPIMHLNGRDFYSFVFNPITGFMPQFFKVEIVNIYTDVRWDVPKLRHGHILTMPLEVKKNPACALFVKETNKLPDVIDLAHLV